MMRYKKHVYTMCVIYVYLIYIYIYNIYVCVCEFFVHIPPTPSSRHHYCVSVVLVLAGLAASATGASLLIVVE